MQSILSISHAGLGAKGEVYAINGTVLVIVIILKGHVLIEVKGVPCHLDERFQRCELTLVDETITAYVKGVTGIVELTASIFV